MDVEQFTENLSLCLISNGIIQDMLFVVSIGKEEETPKVELESIILKPKQRSEFLLLKDGWHLIFRDPFDPSKKVISVSPRTTVYSLESAMHKNCINKKIGDKV